MMPSMKCSLIIFLIYFERFNGEHMEIINYSRICDSPFFRLHIPYILLKVDYVETFEELKSCQTFAFKRYKIRN